MRELIGGVIGVPASILIAAGLGLAGVTLVSRARRKRNPPIRWAHALMGLGIFGIGALVFQLDIAIVGLR